VYDSWNLPVQKNDLKCRKLSHPDNDETDTETEELREGFLLCENGPDDDALREPPIVSAARRGDLEGVKKYIASGDPSVINAAAVYTEHDYDDESVW
jgi:hypothetical protein